MKKILLILVLLVGYSHAFSLKEFLFGYEENADRDCKVEDFEKGITEQKNRGVFNGYFSSHYYSLLYNHKNRAQLYHRIKKEPKYKKSLIEGMKCDSNRIKAHKKVFNIK